MFNRFFNPDTTHKTEESTNRLLRWQVYLCWKVKLRILKNRQTLAFRLPRIDSRSAQRDQTKLAEKVTLIKFYGVAATSKMDFRINVESLQIKLTGTSLMNRKKERRLFIS